MKLIRDFAVIFACLLAGKFIAFLLPFSFPASIIGLLLLFGLLSAGLVRLEWILAGGQLILRHMALLFIPVAAGLLSYADILNQSIGFILFASFSGLVLILLAVGWLYQRLTS